ncbi:Hypothetical predicted protein [Podarcis lilfordi]|uniref:Uncharacterized protein n=1 Tax=Podarcis lilfordi TaxID=74358 RepID=A0AA35LD02_9SAUR|nr:Hypothetical predicted protein [Podarcis lilfordi]
MKLALLFTLLLLLRLLPWGVTQSTAPAPTEDPLMLNETNGSMCAQWLYGTEPPQVEAFQCAGQPDGAEVKFCCGTCDQTRNCSFEELAEGSTARPTDRGPEPCPPLSTLTFWVRMLWFSAGIFVTLVVHWGFPRTRGRFWQRKANTRERQDESDLEAGSSLRPREHRGSSTAYSRSAPPSPAGAARLPGSRGRPAAASSNAPSVQPQAGNERIPLRIEPSPLLPNPGGRRPRARSTY